MRTGSETTAKGAENRAKIPWFRLCQHGIYSCKRSLDKLEPDSGDLASRMVPCNYFLGPFFLSRLTWSGPVNRSTTPVNAALKHEE